MTTRRLQSIGEQIFSHLLPQEEARTQLRDAAPTDLFLHLDEQLIHVPWELCHDGVDFLATKFCIGRYVHSSRPIPSSNRETVAPGLLKVLLIADPTESLPQATQEAEQLCRILDGIAKVKVTLLGGKLVSKAELLTEIQTHDVVHFAGHSHYDPVHPNQSGWHLHGGLLTAEELRNLSRPPLLVFSNSCQAGATTASGGRYRYDEEAGGIGSAFLTAGVWNYIGTFWVVHDEESRDFAVAFYKGITSGLSLGEALRKARQEIRSESGSERLTWASYMLYGDPAVTFFPAKEAKPSPSPAKALERKLVAILHADVKGYSRRIGEDEEATVQTLNAHRAVMSGWIKKHEGEVIGTPAGDDLLVLFPSTVGAVLCAVEIQRELQRRNAELPANRKIEFRIGVNLGEVALQGDNVHGDGVNLAALLQHEVAEPGGICISEVVYEQVKNKPGLALIYEDLGARYFEKIERPIRPYRIRLKPDAAVPVPKQRVRVWRNASARSLSLAGDMAVLVLLLIFPFPKSIPTPPKAIVVRSFLTLKVGAQPEKDPTASIYFNTQLSQVPNLQVYSQEHFEFEIQERKLPEIEIARRLGIEKMIYGSVLTEGTRLHIEAHMNNVQTGKMEATEFVEGEQRDFLNLLQKLARKILRRLHVAVPEEQLFKLNPSLNVYEQMLKGEGVIEPGEPGEGQGVPSQPAPGELEEKHSWVPLWQEWVGGGVAWADEPPSPGRTSEEEIRQALEKYRQAYEQRNLVMLENVYVTFTAAQRQANTDYFQNTQELRVTIRDVDISVSGDKAAVSYTREDEFRDAKTGQKIKLDARFTKIFVRQDGGWKMTMGGK